MTYTVKPKPRDPKPAMVDCTDRPDIIEACERADLTAPRGGWREGRFWVYADSLRQYRESLERP